METRTKRPLPCSSMLSEISMARATVKMMLNIALPLGILQWPAAVAH